MLRLAHQTYFIESVIPSPLIRTRPTYPSRAILSSHLVIFRNCVNPPSPCPLATANILTLFTHPNLTSLNYIQPILFVLLYATYKLLYRTRLRTFREYEDMYFLPEFDKEPLHQDGPLKPRWRYVLRVTWSLVR